MTSEEIPDHPQRGIAGKVLAVTRTLFSSCAIAFLLYFAWRSRALLVDVLASARPAVLVSAALIWVLMHGLSPLFSRAVFRARGCSVTYSKAAEIHISNLPARYLPGGIWHTVGRIAGFREVGIGQRDLAIFVFLENALAAAIAFLVGGGLIAWFKGAQGWGQIATFAALGGLVLLVASPVILKMRVIRGEDSYPIRDFAVAAAIVAVSWCVAAAAFVTYLSAFPALTLQASPLEMGGAYLFSWGVGFVSVFAPQGIGVFEVVASDLIRDSGSLGSVAALLAGFRLVILLADSLAWIAGHFLSLGKRVAE